MPCEDDVGRNYYRYYDTPDGCNIPEKTMVTTRYGVITGLVLSTFDVLMYSHASGLGPMLKRYALHTVPLGLMGATFSLVANGALIARQKDDELNYFLGGLACGPIAAAYLGSKHVVLLGGLALGVIGMIKKDAVNSGYTLLPDAVPHRGSVWKWRMDYTLAKDPKDGEDHRLSSMWVPWEREEKPLDGPVLHLSKGPKTVATADCRNAIGGVRKKGRKTTK